MSLRKRLENSLKNPPLRFQVAGVRFLQRQEGRAILGDDPGLGKTYQVTAFLKLNFNLRPAVVVCPSTIKYVWQRELWKHARLVSEVLEGLKPRRLSLDRDTIYILNYDILKGWVEELIRIRPKVFVMDEAHKTKSRTTIRTRACRRLARRVPSVIGVTATPIISCPIDFFPLLNMVSPKLFPRYWDYAFRYCDPKRGFRGRGWDLRGATNIEELHKKISSIMIRRVRTDVLKELPPKTRTVIPIPISNEDEYQQATEDFVGWYKQRYGRKVKSNRGGEVWSRVMELFKIVALGKMKAAASWIDDWLEGTDKKLVMFARHKKMMRRLRRRFSLCAWVDGSVTGPDRTMMIDRFQTNDKCRLFFGNIQAAGEGTTLHAASDVGFIEMPWTQAEAVQAEDRVLRIGQTANHVNAYYLVGRGTVEEKVVNTIEKSRRVVDRIIDGRVRTEVATIVLKDLLEKSW